MASADDELVPGCRWRDLPVLCDNLRGIGPTGEVAAAVIAALAALRAAPAPVDDPCVCGHNSSDHAPARHGQDCEKCGCDKFRRRAAPAPEPLPADLMAEIVCWSQHAHVGQSESAALLLRVLAALRGGQP